MGKRKSRPSFVPHGQKTQRNNNTTSWRIAGRLTRRQFVAGSLAAVGAMVAGERAGKSARAASSDRWGDLVGRFHYDGKAPERKRLTVDKDVECCGKYDIRDESLMVGEDRGLANVYVYVRSLQGGICPELEAVAEQSVQLDNRDCIFMPHCLKVWHTRQVLSIINSDPVAQNVTFSPLGDTPANIVLTPPPRPEAKATWIFTRAQRIPVPIACSYHPWESAFILPLDHPYADISKVDGTFRIAQLPVGELEFQVWHERVGYLALPQWPKGRFRLSIKPAVNDLGTIRLDPSMFAET